MEQLCRFCVVIRFQDNLFHHSGTFGSLFPFLEKSVVANQVLSDTTSYCFPKIVDKNLTTNAKQNSKKIKECLNQQYPHLNYPEVNPADWGQLFDWAKKGVLYIPAEKSASADAYVFWANGENVRRILAFQLKSGATPVTIANIIDECEKTFVPTLLTACQITLVVAAASLHNTIPSLCGNGITTTNYAVRLDQGAVLKCIRVKEKKRIPTEYSLPKNAQLIILLKQGLESFISSYNIELVQ